MQTIRYALLLSLLIGAESAAAQVVVASEPKEPSLLSLARSWSRESALGDLRELDLGHQDIEVRAWGGFGLTSTRAIVLRRVDGQWSARRAQLVDCTLRVPIPVGDTASETTLRAFASEARRKCGASRGDVSRGAMIISADTLRVESRAASSAAIDTAWKNAVAAGLLTLPARMERNWHMLDGFTYVLEIRQGNIYRAVEIEHLDRPEAPADSVVKKAYAALTRIPGFAEPSSR
jgi:hypothetical protein